MLAANPELEVRPRLASATDADAHELADAIAIDRHERITRQDRARQIGAEKAGSVVAADSEGGLRQIIGAE